LESLHAASEGQAIHEAVKVKPKLQWRLQDVRDARDVEHMPRKATGNEQSQSKAEAM
jgi:hypothetical protein